MDAITINGITYIGKLDVSDDGVDIVGIEASHIPSKGDVERLIKAENSDELKRVSFKGNVTYAVEALDPEVALHVELSKTVMGQVKEVHLTDHQNYKFGKAMGKVGR